MNERSLPAYRTLGLLLSLAVMGGAVCWAVKGNFADYAALLRYLGFAGAIKAGWEHHVKTRKLKAPPP